ncbi:hypothetical protein MWH03_00565 [Klebsiella pneumoniae]|nr:hypothetical protein [Klebsiella pneumoniae]
MTQKTFLKSFVARLAEKLEVKGLAIIEQSRPDTLLFIFENDGEESVISLPAPLGTSEEKVDHLVWALCEEINALLGKDYPDNSWSVRCAFINDIDGVKDGDYARGCHFIAAKNPKRPEASEPSPTRWLMSEAMAPVTNKLLDGEKVIFFVTLGDKAFIQFKDPDIEIPIGVCDNNFLLGELMPSILRFFGNDVRAKRPLGNPAIQGAMLDLVGNAGKVPDKFLAFEMEVVYRDKQQLH